MSFCEETSIEETLELLDNF